MVQPRQNTPLARALAADDPQKAAAIIFGSVQDAQKLFGSESPQYADALFQLAQFFMAIDKLDLAADAVGKAAQVPVPGPEGRQKQLGYLRNQGEVLVQAGELQAAERIHRDGLQQRLEFYGPEHAGFAFGLEALAEVVWNLGRAEEALDLVQQAMAIFHRDGDPQFIPAFVLRAFILRTLMPTEPVFEFERADDEVIDAMVEHTLSRAERSEPATAQSVLGNLLGEVAAVRDLTDHRLLPIANALADQARLAGDLEAWRGALESSLQFCAASGQDLIGVKVEQALALAQDVSGLEAQAEKTYRTALKRAKTFGDATLMAGLLRNYGLFLDQHDRSQEAQPKLQQAVQAARAGREPEMIGRCLVALGIQHQHAGRLSEAQPLLEESLSLLAPMHADALSGRSHLEAIKARRTCGCGDMAGAMGQAIEEVIRRSLPPGLLKSVQLGEDQQIQVKLTRKPTDEEAQQLSAAMEAARYEYRKHSKKTGYS
ncbi:MAG TPA: tetratricopeptide repeat protein [Isosphaeraceae bacterium]|jgi:tetratricopeptide (TPR) repeat protein|nr:tetratricopeptide repeat protein [Isosphaeraceae bacterium]